jgi:F-box/leucine-rich repeat protein 2/20
MYCVLQNIQDEAVQQLAENCSRLHYLCLSGCSHLTDTSLIVLAQQCHMLSTIEVAGCSQFTDTGFQALARVSSEQFEEIVVLTE